MQTLRSKLGAWLLVLLLGRVMAPEAAVLSLHSHQHTIDVSPPATTGKSAGKHQVSKQHQHCHAEQLYNAAFQPALPPPVPLPLRQPDYPHYQVVKAMCSARHLLPGAALRGPPTA